MTELVRLERQGAIATIVFDNPPVNALGRQTFVDLEAVVAEVEADFSLRAVILAGTGERAFLAGADLSEFAELISEPGLMKERGSWSRSIFTRIERLKPPVIAAVQASAVGGGTEVALLCDFVLSDPRAMFGLTETRLGLIPGAGGTQRLPRRIGASRAKELILFGSVITAEEAHRVGLVNRISEPGRVFEAALEAARALSELPAQAVQAAKRAVDEGLTQDLDTGLDIEQKLFLSLLDTEDAREGYRAFLERRVPNFLHK